MHIYNLGQKFKSVAAMYAKSTALITEDESNSYAELDRRSDIAAAQLALMGVQIGEVVCICGHKDGETIVAILAAIKSGATYSVFDPESPFERLSKIFRQCKPKLIICDQQLIAEFQEKGHRTLDLATLSAAVADSISGADSAGVAVQSKVEAPSGINEQIDSIVASQPAYIMFTSGSTGFPKGATMTHQNVLNLIAWSEHTYSISNEDVLTNVNPLFFDNSVFDFYSSLFTGAALVLFKPDTVRNPGRLMQLINEFRCTIWFSVPSMLIFLQTMRAFKPDNMAHIKKIIFGGEGYPKAKLKNLFEVYSKRIEFYNVYGPTECTCICSSYTVSESDFADLTGFLPLGHLSPNFNYLLVDDKLQLVEPNQVGELLLLGPNVGLGYFNDPERTRASFIQSPVNDSYAEPCYRTGDLVHFNSSDGKLYIWGRKDNQIKHMGYRIELEEIENALSCVESVKQGAVIHCEVGSLSQIVAFIETHNGSLEESFLRDELHKIIPGYMIPSRFQFRSHLPKNANGKLDRNRMKSEYMEQVANG